MDGELTTADIGAPASSGLLAQMEWAKAAAVADILPVAYRGKPANVMIAVGLGAAMGLTPAEALYRIHVVEGKPSAAAELIAANVRRAGHKLRVATGDDWAEASIWRTDDPDYPHTVRRDMAWARQMKLAAKDNYAKQPITMLTWRAITAVARLACSEALYGVAYTPDELDEHPGANEPRTSLADVWAPPTEAEPQAPGRAEAIRAGIGRLGLSAPAAIGLLERVTGRKGARTTNLTPAEATAVLAEIAQLDEPEQGTLDGGAE